MRPRPTSVRRWPTTFSPEQNLVLVAVETPDSPIRDTARELVRRLLREILGDVELVSEPGQPIRLAHHDNRLGISVSHERGMSLLAIHRSGPVGVDLLCITDNPDWQGEIQMLTGDYLGPQVARQLTELPAQAAMTWFAQAWTAHEARLKCLGIGLSEWDAALETDLSKCRAQELALPAGYVGSVATLKSAENPGA